MNRFPAGSKHLSVKWYFSRTQNQSLFANDCIQSLFVYKLPAELNINGAINFYIQLISLRPLSSTFKRKHSFLHGFNMVSTMSRSLSALFAMCRFKQKTIFKLDDVMAHLRTIFFFKPPWTQFIQKRHEISIFLLKVSSTSCVQ